MIVHEVEQGTAQWYALRRGIVTASSAHKIITPAKGELSKQSRQFAYRLLVERLLNTTTETLSGQEWMTRGKELEPKAVTQFEITTDQATEPAGFVTTDDGTLGASPDRFLSGRSAGLEIKAPSPVVHIGYLLDGPGADYRPQCQMQLLVCEFERVEFYSYSDRMPPRHIVTHRDEPYLAAMRSALAQFNEQLLEMLERAKSLGVYQAYAEAATPTEVERAQDLDSVFRHELAIIE